MNSPAYIIAKYLESLGVGTVGTDIFVGKEPETAGTIATLYDTGGRDPMHNLCADPDANTWRPSVQLRVRADSYPTAFARISAMRRSILGLTGYSITEVAAGVQTTDSILDTVARSDIISIGEDANNRPVLTANFDLLSSSHQFTVDKSALQSALAAAGALTESDYTPASWAVLADAVTSGQGVYDDPSATQQQADDATQEINDAIAALVAAACTSCLGAWTGDIAAAFGAQPLTTSGACGNTISVSNISPSTYAASTAQGSPLSINWPASEVRVMQVNPIELMDVPSYEYLLLPALLDLAETFLHYLNYRWDDDAGSGEIIPFIAGSYGASGVAITARLTPFMIGLSGDGHLYAITASGYQAADYIGHETVNIANPMLPAAYFDNTQLAGTGNSSMEIITDAASMTVAVPDMSADGITVVKDFCGNVVS